MNKQLLSEANRILIFGCGGVGKSTLCRSLGERLDLPIIHLDYYYWQPNWIETPKDEWRDKVKELVQGERWVMDGNFFGTLDLRMALADAVIYLDFPRWFCYYRILKRYKMERGKVRKDIGPGCFEKADWAFMKWIWGFNKKLKPQIFDAIEKYGKEDKTIILRSVKEINKISRL